MAAYDGKVIAFEVELELNPTMVLIIQLDPDGKMLGIVTVDDAIDAIMPEKIAHSLPRFTRQREARVAAG